MNCPKCNGEMELHMSKSVVLVHGKPKLFSKGTWRQTKAYVCIECGFVEFYIDE